jgi:WD40 repeat protein
VNGLAFSPDGTKLVIGSEDGTVTIWETADIRERRTFTALTDGNTPIRCVAFHPDGNVVAWGTSDGTIKLWDIVQGTQHGETLRGHLPPVNSIAFSADGKTLVSSGAPQSVKIWDVATGAQLASMSFRSTAALCVAFAPNENVVAIAAGNLKRSVGAVKFWDVSGELTHALADRHTKGIKCLTFSQDSGRLATGGLDETAKIWNARTATLQATLPHPGGVHFVAFSSDGRLLVSAMKYAINQRKVKDGARVRLWDTVTWQEKRTQGWKRLETGMELDGLVLSPDGTILAISQGSSIQLWDVRTGEQRFIGQETNGDTLTFSQDGRLLALGGGREVVIWNVGTQQRVVLPEKYTHGVKMLTLDPVGETLLTIWGDGTERLWDLNARRVRFALKRPIYRSLFADPDHKKPFAISPDGKTMAVWTDRQLKLMDVHGGHELFSLPPPWGGVTFSAVAPDGSVLGGRSGLREEGGVTSLAFSPDGKVLAAGTGLGVLKLWHAATDE